MTLFLPNSRTTLPDHAEGVTPRVGCRGMLNAFKLAQDNSKQAQDIALSSAKEFESAEKFVNEAKSTLQHAAKTFSDRLQQQGLSIEGFEAQKEHIDQIDAMNSKISSFKEQLAVVQDRAKITAEAIEGKLRPNLAVFRQASLDAESVRATETENAATLKARALHLETLLESISTEMAHIEKIEQETAELRELAALVNANNSAQLDLETFAIGAMFDQVLYAANLRLQPMTIGRYSLQRELEGKGRARRGLGITVYDIHTDKTRAPSTLSGGETFKRHRV